MKPITAGQLAAGAAGTAGIGSTGVLAEALVRIAMSHAVPAAMWWMMTGLIAVPAAVASLALILDDRQKKRELEVAAELDKTRQGMYRVLLEKAAGEPASSENYRDLIDADTRHLSAERSGAQPADQAHRRLRGHRAPDSAV